MENNFTREWYDSQYSKEDSRYGNCYHVLPEWAAQTNRLYAGYVVALNGLIADGCRVLDLGSGMGYYVDAFNSIGCAAQGVEWSPEAAKNNPLVTCGDITDLSCFEDDSFDLVFSAQVYEHMMDEQVIKSFKENQRVGLNQVHFIADEVGGDPSHINIKPNQGWLDLFSTLTDAPHYMFPDPLNPNKVFFVEHRVLPPLMAALSDTFRNKLTDRGRV